MNIVEKVIKHAFLFDLFVASILFFIVCGWLRFKLASFNRLMVTASPQYDFIKSQIMSHLSENYKDLMKGIIKIVNNEESGEDEKHKSDNSLVVYFTLLYTKFDPFRKTKLGHIKFERALHFCLKTKLISHPLDLIGTRNSVIAERVAVRVRQSRDDRKCRSIFPTRLLSSCCWKKAPRRQEQKHHATVIFVVSKCILPLILNCISSFSCLRTFVQLSTVLLEVINSPAFINNEYLICQNLIYVEGNSSLPVYQSAQQVTDVRSAFMQVLVLVLTGSILLCFFILSSLVNTPLVSLWHAVYNAIIMESPLHMSADIARVEDLYRRFDLVGVRGRIVGGILLCLSVGVYLTCSTILVEITKTTSCVLPEQLILDLNPSSRPSILLALLVSLVCFTQAQNTTNNIQHEFVLSTAQKFVHWLACLVNSVGITLILVTMSANMMQLFTSFMDEIILDPVSLVAYSLLFVFLGYTCTLLSLMLLETLVNMIQYLMTSGTVPTDTIQTPSISTGIRFEFGRQVCGVSSTSSLIGGGLVSSLFYSLQLPTAQTGWRRRKEMKILTYSSIHSASLQKSLLSYVTGHMLALLQICLTVPASHHAQDRVTLVVCSALAIPVSTLLTLMLSWIYFRLDSSFFTLANIHFIPEDAIDTGGSGSLSSTETTVLGSNPCASYLSSKSTDKPQKEDTQPNPPEAQYSEIFATLESQNKQSKKKHEVIRFGRLHFGYDGDKPVFIDMKLNRFNLDRAAGLGAVWLDLGGGMEPDDENWEMAIYHMATLPRRAKFPGQKLASLSSNSFKVLKTEEKPRNPITRRYTIGEADRNTRYLKPLNSSKPREYYNIGPSTRFPGNQLLGELAERISIINEQRLASLSSNSLKILRTEEKLRNPIKRRYTIGEADLNKRNGNPSKPSKPRDYYNIGASTRFPGNQLLGELAERISIINDQKAAKERKHANRSQSQSYFHTERNYHSEA